MSNYLIELFVIHVVLILGYWLFLRKERQYDKMRLYLLGSTFLALIIPLIKLPKLFSEPVEPLPLGVIQVEAMTITSAADTSGWPYDNLLIWL